MRLVAIDPYPMPDRTALPHSPTARRIDPLRVAPLVHDMRNHLVGAFPAGRSPVVELVDNIAALRSHPGRPPRSKGRDQRISCGMYAHLGVPPTAADAFMNDIQPFVVADAVADSSAEEHALALRRAARGGMVRTTDGLPRGPLPHLEPNNA